LRRAERKSILPDYWLQHIVLLKSCAWYCLTTELREALWTAAAKLPLCLAHWGAWSCTIALLIPRTVASFVQAPPQFELQAESGSFAAAL
jgi:hypothetical protein